MHITYPLYTPSPLFPRLLKGTYINTERKSEARRVSLFVDEGGEGEEEMTMYIPQNVVVVVVVQICREEESFRIGVAGGRKEDEVADSAEGERECVKRKKRCWCGESEGEISNKPGYPCWKLLVV
jgi:hypothetical protein